ncbi:MAG: glycoside hydrolase [Ruminococcus sp.]|nr:glycoside hydrolase [Ruminococcus sp.]
MNICKFFSLAAAAAVSVSALYGCSKKKVKVIEKAPVPIIEQEPTSTAVTTTETTVVETYPDYPVDFPEIEQKDTGNLYEAEYADFPDNLPIASEKENFSGNGYVTGFAATESSSVTFSVDIPSNQHYDLLFNVASEKTADCSISLNGTPLTSFKTTSDGKFTQITVYGVFLAKGKSAIKITPSDSSVCLDYMKLSNNTSLSEISYDADGGLVNKNAGESAKELMSFLTENYGKYIITGQYAADDDNSELDLIYRTTGKYPVIRFSNLDVPKGSFDESFRKTEACADWYRNGGIPCVTWYWSSPSDKSSIRTEDCNFSLAEAVTELDIALLSQEEIRGLYGEGNISEQCYRLVLDIDNMAGQLISLKNKGVPVLWRPLPEGCGDWYWWGASGADAYKWLWELLYVRLTDYYALDNLIWIWNGQSESTLVDKLTFDIAAVDLYINDEKDYGSRFYEEFAAVQKFVGSDKLISISECGSVPDIDCAFRDNAVWSFFGLWFGSYIEDENGNYSEKFTSRENLVRTYNSDGALTLDEYKKLTGTENSSSAAPESTSSAASAADEKS